MPQLGSTQLSTANLGDTVQFYGMETAFTSTTTQTVSPTSKSSQTIETASPTVETDELQPSILDPANVNVEYNNVRELWESAWLPTDTFDTERDQLVAVVQTDDVANPLDVVVERDLTGDGRPDIHSDPVTVDTTTEIATFAPEGESGRYRLLFPTYGQFDTIERINVAITYDNRERLIENIPYDFLKENIRFGNVDGSDDITPLIDALATTINRIDATIDSLYDNRFVESARGGPLELLGKPVGVQRRDIGSSVRSDDLETDSRLRKRVAAARALVGLDTSSPSFAQLLSLLFPDGITGISTSVRSDEPVLDLTIPTDVMDRHPLNQFEVESILKRAVASSYNVDITVSGSFDFEDSVADRTAWNGGGWTRIAKAVTDLNIRLEELGELLHVIFEDESERIDMTISDGTGHAYLTIPDDMLNDISDTRIELQTKLNKALSAQNRCLIVNEDTFAFKDNDTGKGFNDGEWA